MNTDDPKLTAFALDELDEPERSRIAREVAESPEAQRLVKETREVSCALKKEFAAEVKNETPAPTAVRARRSLIDIRDDPWFWVRARPLAIAAAVSIFALLAAIVIATYQMRREIASPRPDDTFVEEERNLQNATELATPDHVANPLRTDVIGQIDRVVIGEIGSDSSLEIRTIESINDTYRIQRLKKRLSTPELSRKSFGGLAARRYGLIFLNRMGDVIASAAFYHSAETGFALQPVKNAYQRSGRYFLGGDNVLAGDWKTDIDYQDYVIPFPDWNECIGYAPGA